MSLFIGGKARKKASSVGIDITSTAVRLLELKVPVLGDLPGVGALFRRTANTNKKVETLIFITPRILSEVLLD